MMASTSKSSFLKTLLTTDRLTTTASFQNIINSQIFSRNDKNQIEAQMGLQKYPSKHKGENQTKHAYGRRIYSERKSEETSEINKPVVLQHMSTYQVSEETNARKSKRKNWPQKVIIETSKYECDMCKCLFDCLSTYKQHLTECKQDIDFRDDTEIPNNISDEACHAKTGFTEIKSETRETDHRDSRPSLEGKIDVISCKHCDKTFSKPEQLAAHQRIHKTPVDEDFKCLHCGKVFSFKKNFAEHMLEAHGDKKAFKCNICGKLYEIYDSLKRHYRVHNKDTALTCDECGKSFAEKITLKRHKTIHTGEKPFNCGVCGLAFRDPSTMRKHVKRHSSERPYKCETCGKQFVSTYDLRKHSHIHLKDEERPYRCEVCGKAFYLIAALKTHVRTHSGEKPHKCDICSSNFCDQRNLFAHMKTHSSEKTHQCEICGTTFKWGCNLGRHMKIVHDGQKSFICTVCGKRFGQKVALTVHERLHTGIRPHECHLCGKTFRDKTCLTRHMDVHTKVRPFTCNICHQKFVRKFVLQRHMEIHSKPKAKSLVVNSDSPKTSGSDIKDCVLVQNVDDAFLLSNLLGVQSKDDKTEENDNEIDDKCEMDNRP